MSTGYWPHYEVRRKILPIAYNMEHRGVTVSIDRHKELVDEFRKESDRCGCVLTSIAEEYDWPLELPKGSAVNNNLRDFIFDVMKLEPIVNPKAKTETPSLDSKNAIPHYLKTLERGSMELHFIQTLQAKRARDGALSQLMAYDRFWRPIDSKYAILHPNLNPTGTSTLRWSSSNPNEQNCCLDGETEILTERGWIRFDELEEGVKVAQYHVSGIIDFVQPELQKHHFKGEMLHITTKDQLDLMMTPNHRCLFRNGKTGKLRVRLASQFPKWDQVLQAGQYLEGKRTLTEDQVVVMCALQADGSFNEWGTVLWKGFKKDRKKERLRKALDRLGVKYSTYLTQREGVSYEGYYVASEDPLNSLMRELLPNKMFGSKLLEFDRATLDLIAQEVFFWDGASTTEREYSSSDRQNSDWIQILWSLSGRRARMRLYRPSNENARDHWIVGTPQETTDYSYSSNHTVTPIPWDDYVYCVTVPSSYIIVRRNGRIAVTGNSKRGILTEQDCDHCEGLGCKLCDDSGKQATNVRYCFGPREGREWWSCDGKNLERRITAYKAPEPLIIALFERPDDPPYFGSEHLLVAHLLYPKEFETCRDANGQVDGRIFKKRYADTLYQWVKNGDFSMQYQAGRATADATFKRPGAYDLLQSRFSNQAALNTQLVNHAKKFGYVETVPDISVDPKRGYPLLCARTEYGEILPTTPLNYWGQGTACWWMMQSMIRCHEQLEKWRVDESFDGYITLQVHDELVFDFPSASNRGNLDRVMKLKELMELGGQHLEIPTPVSVEHNEHNWSEGVTCA